MKSTENIGLAQQEHERVILQLAYEQNVGKQNQIKLPSDCCVTEKERKIRTLSLDKMKFKKKNQLNKVSRSCQIRLIGAFSFLQSQILNTQDSIFITLVSSIYSGTKWTINHRTPYFLFTLGNFTHCSNLISIGINFPIPEPKQN